MDCTIVRRRSCIGSRRTCGGFRKCAEEEGTSSAGTGLAFGKVRSVTVDMKLHVTGLVPDNGIWVSGTVVQELCDSLSSGFCSF